MYVCIYVCIQIYAHIYIYYIYIYIYIYISIHVFIADSRACRSLGRKNLLAGVSWVHGSPGLEFVHGRPVGLPELSSKPLPLGGVGI